MPKTELFIGNLGKEVEKKDIEDVFDKYGRMIRCDIKNKGNFWLNFLKSLKKQNFFKRFKYTIRIRHLILLY